MKPKFNLKTIILAILLVVAGSTAFAQCDKTATLTASSTIHLNEKGEVERTRDEESIITFDKKNISVTTDGSHELTGIVKTYQCNWTTPYKDGKTVITTILTDGGKAMNATITVEGKGGVVTLTFTAVEMPGKKVKLVADKFE